MDEEQLLAKGFKINEYEDGKYYVLIINNPETDLLDIIGENYDPSMMPEQLIIQLTEDLTSITYYIEGYDAELVMSTLEVLLAIL